MRPRSIHEYRSGFEIFAKLHASATLIQSETGAFEVGGISLATGASADLVGLVAVDISATKVP